MRFYRLYELHLGREWPSDYKGPLLERPKPARADFGRCGQRKTSVTFYWEI